MFDWFKKNGNGVAKNNQPALPGGLKMADIEGTPLSVGDKVESLRYDLGVCLIVQAEHGFEYESLETGQRVSYARMVDAATTFQKVKKL